MILQALNEYYERKAADVGSQVAPQGFEWKEIPYILVLNSEGYPVSLNCTTEGTGKLKRSKKILVPQTVKRASGIAANLLWDNAEYVFGVVLKGKPERVKNQHADFVQRTLSVENEDCGLQAVKRFLQIENKVQLMENFGKSWKELLETPGANITFQLSGESKLVVESEFVKISETRSDFQGSSEDRCLVTGNKEEPARLHSSIKGVWGAQSSGANIVSFNRPSFCSFNKEQGLNSPIGKSASFAYTNALNQLLDKDSLQRMQVGDASTVFWSESSSSEFECQISSFFNEPPKDDPDQGVNAVRSLFSSIHNGAFSADEGKTRFFVLGLSPNASRISVRFWIVGTIQEMAHRIARHFQDIQIVHGPKDRDHLSIFRLLVSTATQGKSENIPPNLAGETMRSILEGRPYPQTLLQAAVRRIRSEREVSYPRASIIKACLNRFLRFHNHQQEKELLMSLDYENKNIGYRLGRLFSTLEKIQLEANPGINATIRDKFYGSASGSPVTVFGNLMRLKNHHLAKIENPGRRVNLERLLGEIVSEIHDFPPHLKLEDQGRFAIGYYHQMQEFYKPKEKSE